MVAARAVRLDIGSGGDALGLLAFAGEVGEGEVVPSISPSQCSSLARCRRVSKSASIASRRGRASACTRSMGQRMQLCSCTQAVP
jgi:hypothetical protein